MFPLRSTPKTASAPRPEISAPMDGRKLAPGPNQLAGLLGKAPDKLKGQVLDMQNRPAAFHEGSQATRRLAGRDVTISNPILGMRLPAGRESAMPGKAAPAKGGSTAAKKESEGRPSTDLSSLEGPPASTALTRRDSRGGTGGQGGSSAGHQDQQSQALVKYEGKGEPRIVEILDMPSSLGRTEPLPQRGSFDLSSAEGGHDPKALVKHEGKPAPKADVPADSQALVKYEGKPQPKREGPAMDLGGYAGGHDPLQPQPKKNQETPFRMTGPADHVPTPMSSMTTTPEHIPTPPQSPRPPLSEARPSERPPVDERPVFTPRPQLHRQDTRPHVDPGLENLHLSQPGHFDGPPPAYSPKPPAGHHTTEMGPGAAELADAAEGEKKMGLGKKVMMGVGGIAALLGITFLMSTPTPPPPPDKST